MCVFSIRSLLRVFGAVQHFVHLGPFYQVKCQFYGSFGLSRPRILDDVVVFDSYFQGPLQKRCWHCRKMTTFKRPPSEIDLGLS